MTTQSVSPADDIARHLALNSVGTLGGAAKWSLAINLEPITPPEAITVYDTGGLDPDTDSQNVYRPFFQVRVRGPIYTEAYAKQTAIRDLLINNDPVLTANSLFTTIALNSDIMSLGQDDNKRFVLVANYRAIRERN